MHQRNSTYANVSKTTNIIKQQILANVTQLEDITCISSKISILVDYARLIVCVTINMDAIPAKVLP